MEDRKLNEKESLELISRMIRETRENIGVGKDNSLLVYGYSALALSIIVFAVVTITGNNVWHFIWMLMFVPALVKAMRRDKTPKALTYTDSMVNKIWQVCGSLFGLTFIAIPVIGIPASGAAEFSLMLPLSILYYSIGVAVTGLVINVKIMTWSSLIGFLVAVYMLIAKDIVPTVYWNLWFGGVFLLTGIIPGHIINARAK